MKKAADNNLRPFAFDKYYRRLLCNRFRLMGQPKRIRLQVHCQMQLSREQTVMAQAFANMNDSSLL
ncbi:hypothetical protein D3C77_800910 [compost metagenome]